MQYGCLVSLFFHGDMGEDFAEITAEVFGIPLHRSLIGTSETKYLLQFPND